MKKNKNYTKKKQKQQQKVANTWKDIQGKRGLDTGMIVSQFYKSELIETGEWLRKICKKESNISNRYIFKHCSDSLTIYQLIVNWKNYFLLS